MNLLPKYFVHLLRPKKLPWLCLYYVLGISDKNEFWNVRNLNKNLKWLTILVVFFGFSFLGSFFIGQLWLIEHMCSFVICVNWPLSWPLSPSLLKKERSDSTQTDGVLLWAGVGRLRLASWYCKIVIWELANCFPTQSSG